MKRGVTVVMGRLTGRSTSSGGTGSIPHRQLPRPRPMRHAFRQTASTGLDNGWMERNPPQALERDQAKESEPVRSGDSDELGKTASRPEEPNPYHSCEHSKLKTSTSGLDKDRTPARWDWETDGELRPPGFACLCV